MGAALMVGDMKGKEGREESGGWRTCWAEVFACEPSLLAVSVMGLLELLLLLGFILKVGGSGEGFGDLRDC